MRAPVLNARHVRCAGCGAPAGDPLLVACDYCLAPLGTRACPTCHCRMADGVQFCPWCGAVTVTPSTRETAMRCPCGDGDLVERVLPASRQAAGVALALAECVTCHGVWVTRASIDRMITSHADDTILLALAPGIAATQARVAVGAGVDAVRYRPCPECRTLMNRVNYARISGIIVDVCRSHGTWFDVHELPALLEFVRAGGLDTARAREREALELERRRLVQQHQMRVAMESSRPSRTGGLRDARRIGASSVFTLLGELFGGR
jgi:Zn-finger nucleic acid-binding protein